MISKLGGTLDRVNTQLDKVDVMTDSAVDAVSTVDTGCAVVTRSVTRPVQALAGLFTGARHATSAVRTGASWQDAVDTGREEAARREQDLADELRPGRHALIRRVHSGPTMAVSALSGVPSLLPAAIVTRNA